MTDPAVFDRADAVLDPGVNPVGGVDIGELGSPAPGRSMTHRVYRQPSRVSSKDSCAPG